MPCTPESMVKTQMAAQAGSSGYHGDAARPPAACSWGSLFQLPAPTPASQGSGALRPHLLLQQLPLTVPVRTKDGVGSVRREMTHSLLLGSASAELRGGSSITQELILTPVKAAGKPGFRVLATGGRARAQLRTSADKWRCMTQRRSQGSGWKNQQWETPRGERWWLKAGIGDHVVTVVGVSFNTTENQ